MRLLPRYRRYASGLVLRLDTFDGPKAMLGALLCLLLEIGEGGQTQCRF